MFAALARAIVFRPSQAFGLCSCFVLVFVASRAIVSLEDSLSQENPLDLPRLNT